MKRKLTKKKQEKNKKLSLNEMMFRLGTGRYTYSVFWGKVKTYLELRIKSKSFLDDFEIELLNKRVGEMNDEDKVSPYLKEIVSKIATRAIVMSKNTNNEKIVNKISQNIDPYIEFQDTNDAYAYYESAVKYAERCLSKRHFGILISFLGNNIDKLEEAKKLLTQEKFIVMIDKRINFLKQKFQVADVFKELPVNISYKSHDEDLPIIEGKNIITIDRPGARVFDSAFSVEKQDDSYLLNVYVADAPSFLLANEDVLKYSYQMGIAMYNNQQPYNNYKVDMIPSRLDEDYLGLTMDGVRKVIVFSFRIDEKGSYELVGVSRNRAKINENVTDRRTRGYEFSDPRTDNDMGIYRKVCELVNKGSSVQDFSQLNLQRLTDIISFTSIITNYEVGRNSNLAIYRKNGVYTKDSEDKYAYAVSPLRRFASDINLITYLNQLGLLNCPDKYIYYLEDHLDEVIEHLNRREDLSVYFGSNYGDVKTYYKDKKQM